MLTGTTEICMTKIDVLNIFEQISAATHYTYEGQTSGALPFDLCETAVTPILKTYPGWSCSLDDIHSFDDLPPAAKVYLQDLEQYLGVPFTMISTGPEREKLILR
jgi:adenylosuccinate synthase